MKRKITAKQRDIVRYIKTQFAAGYKTEPIGDEIIELTDIKGATMRFCCNQYGDIMDADTQQIIATSNLSHAAGTPTERPKEWNNSLLYFG